MSEILELLAKTYSGSSTEDIEAASNQLDEFGCSVEFLQTLFSIVLNEEIQEELKLSAIIRIKYDVSNHWSIDMDDDIKSFVLSQIPAVINLNSSKFLKIIIELISNISGQEFCNERWLDFITFVNTFKEGEPLVFASFHAAISKMLIPNSLSKTKELMQNFVAELSEYATNIENVEIVIILIKSLQLYIKKDHSLCECIDDNFTQMLVHFLDNYGTVDERILCRTVSFLSCVFKQLDGEIALHISEILIALIQNEVSQKLFKKCTLLLVSIMTRKESYENCVKPNIEEFVENFLFPYFKMNESEKEESESNVSSFLSSYQTDFSNNDDNRTLIYLAISQASHDEELASTIFQFTVALIQQEDVTPDDIFSSLFMLSSCIPFLSDASDEINGVINECFGSENDLVISGALQCASKMYNFDCPLEFYGNIFGSLGNESLLVRNYAIEALTELLINEPNEEISDAIKENFTENVPEFISIIFQTSDEMGCPSLNIAVIHLITFFGEESLTISCELAVKLFEFYVSDSDILSTYDSILSSISNIIIKSEQKNEIIASLYPLINDVLQEKDDPSIEKVFILLANIMFVADESISFAEFYDHVISLVRKYPSTFQSSVYFMHNLFIREPAFLLENFESVFGFIFSKYEREISSGLPDDLSPILQIFAVIFEINQELDISPIISLLDQETLEMLFHCGDQGPREFFIVAMERTDGRMLEAFSDATSLIECFSMKATGKEIAKFLETSGQFIDQELAKDLSQYANFEDDESNDVIVHLLPINNYDQSH